MTLEGECDSRGSFSIDYSKALEKLSTRLFTDPTSYLLKFVQAALCGGSQYVDIVAHKDRLEIHFTSREFTSKSMQDFSDKLHQPWAHSSQPAWSHLQRALQVARAQSGDCFWAVQDGQGGVGYRLESDSVLRHEVGPSPGAQTSECVFCIRKPPSLGLWQAEKLALQRKCSSSPWPIRWNQRLLHPAVPEVPSESEQLGCLLDRLILSRDEPQNLLCLPHLTNVSAMVYDLGAGYRDLYSYGNTLLHQWRTFPSQHQKPLFDSTFRFDFHLLESDFLIEIFGLPPKSYALSHGPVRPGSLKGRGNFYQILYVAGVNGLRQAPFSVPQGRFGRKSPFLAQAWFRCPPWSEQPSQLHLLKDGVSLDPVEIECPLKGLQVYVADRQAETDLSGLTPLQNERLADIQTWVTGECLKAKKELRKTLRWNDKYGLSDEWTRHVTDFHRLDLDE